MELIFKISADTLKKEIQDWMDAKIKSKESS